MWLELKVTQLRSGLGTGQPAVQEYALLMLPVCLSCLPGRQLKTKAYELNEYSQEGELTVVRRMWLAMQPGSADPNGGQGVVAAGAISKCHPRSSKVTRRHCPSSTQGYPTKIIIIHLFIMQQPFELLYPVGGQDKVTALIDLIFELGETAVNQ